MHSNKQYCKREDRLMGVRTALMGSLHPVHGVPVPLWVGATPLPRDSTHHTRPSLSCPYDGRVDPEREPRAASESKLSRSRLQCQIARRAVQCHAPQQPRPQPMLGNPNLETPTHTLAHWHTHTASPFPAAAARARSRAHHHDPTSPLLQLTVVQYCITCYYLSLAREDFPDGTANGLLPMIEFGSSSRNEVFLEFF